MAKFGASFKKVQLNNVIWVPELKTNLISTSKATDNECKVEMTNNFARISRNNETLVEGEKLEGLYIVTVIHENVNAVEEANINTNLQLWHKRFGHLNISALKILKKDKMIHGIPNLGDVSVNCETCVRGKQTADPFPAKNEKSSSQVVELIHTDLCGPMQSESMSRKRYFVTFIDDYSRKVEVKFLQYKSEYLNAFKEYKASTELQTGQKIKCIRSDNAKELVSGEFSTFLKLHGIKHQLTVPQTPQQNGVAERMNRT